MDAILTGTVKFYNQKKGYGFIINKEDNEEYFFHFSKCLNTTIPDKDDIVLFELEDTKRGINAVNVRLKNT